MATHQAIGDGPDGHSDSEIEEGKVFPYHPMPSATVIATTESEGNMMLPVSGLLATHTGGWHAIHAQQV